VSSAVEPRRDVRLRRARRGRMLGGVCAGLARELGIDPLIVRLAFVAAAAAGGVGVVIYALAWVLLGDDTGERGVAMRLPRTGRAGLEVAGGIGLLLLALLLGLRQIGVPFSDVIVWPTVLIAAGGALLWRGSAVSPDRPEEGEPAEEASSSQVLSRTGLGVVLVVLAMLAFLQATGALGAARDVLLAIVAVTVALGVIFAPYTVRLARSLAAERSERIRSQERAEMAAHLHDSVLQTLALVQRRADDPAEVAALARRQERELRAWLAGRTAAGGAPRLAAALDAAAAEVETDHGVPVEVVAVGDADLDERGLALVAAAREAMVNAAKFAGGGPIDVYAEAEDGRLQVFVRDRGPGFDPDAVPEDRRGVRESIVARMARHGGSARITAAPGAGTEVELVLEDR
jgi:signal transduction histidine kinase/phage shock protein PspC (stress-responsive transcriptional regulator)